MAKSEDAGPGKGGLFKVTAANYRDIKVGTVRGALAFFSHDHDPIAADNLIRYFHHALQEGDLFSNRRRLGKTARTFLEFIEQAFARYIEGKSIDAAFGLVKTKGQRDIPDHSLRNLGIASKVELLVRAEMKKRNITERYSKDGKNGRLVSSVKMEPICRDVALEADVGWKSVEKIYADLKGSVSALDNQTLSLLTE